MIDAAIIGGGISGLSAAYELKVRGFEIKVLERQNRCGGVAVSEKSGGFLIEHGPSSISTSVGGVEGFSRQLGLDAQKCGLKADVRYRYLIKDGQPCPISTSPLGFFTSSYLSPLAKINLLLEFFRARGDAANESVAQFCNRRFGAEFTRMVIEPLVTGLYGARAGDVALKAAFPALERMERQYGSLIAAVIAKKASGRKMPAKRLFSWQNGIASLPDALASVLSASVYTGVAIRRITKSAEGFSIDMGAAGRLRARSVIIAVQPHAAGALLGDMDKEAAGALFDIPAPPISIVYLGYSQEKVAHELAGIGYLTPESEGRTASGVLFPSSMFAARAPEGHVALSVYIGGSRAPDAAVLPRRDLIALAREEVGDMLGASGEPVMARIRQWPRGLPQMSTGHNQRLGVLKGAGERHEGLFFTGNYFSGPGISYCINNARIAAAKTAEYLGAGHSLFKTGRACNIGGQ